MPSMQKKTCLLAVYCVIVGKQTLTVYFTESILKEKLCGEMLLGPFSMLTSSGIGWYTRYIGTLWYCHQYDIYFQITSARIHYGMSEVQILDLMC